jgi:hypothetical protein
MASLARQGKRSSAPGLRVSAVSSQAFSRTTRAQVPRAILSLSNILPSCQNRVGSAFVLSLPLLPERLLPALELRAVERGERPPAGNELGK